LIISGPTDETTDLYYRINAIIPQLKPEHDYTIEEKTKTASLTEEGNVRVEKLLGVDNLYDSGHMELVHHVVKALQAYALYKRDVDYVVKRAKSLSWMSSPGDSCRDAAGATACIRPSKPKKA